MTFRAHALVPTLFLLAACGGATKEYDDPGIQSSSKAVGSSSTTLGEMDSGADDSTIQANTQAVGSNVQALVSQHQAVSATTSIPGIDLDTMQQEGTDTVSWDGTHLIVNWSGDDLGFTIDYDVDMTFTSSAEGGQVIDGHYDLVYSADITGISYDYDIRVVYDAMTSDSAGCVVSGGFRVDYDISLAVGGATIPGFTGSDQSGRVIVAFNGCDDVTVTGT